LQISEIFDQLSLEGKEILNSIGLNLLTIECYENLRGKLSKPADVNLERVVNKMISNSIPENLAEETKQIIRSRIGYWVSREKTVSWLTTIDRIGNRRTPRRGLLKKSCEWPGCDNETELELDHKFPYSLGGEENDENIQTLCKWCNRVKGNNPLMILNWPGE
jgi:5-methylcytosine-specific restriction endonuclease McrA